MSVHLGRILINNQFDAHFLLYIYLFRFSTCFEQPSAHHQESQLYQYIIWYMSLCVGDRRGELSYLAPLGSENISSPYFFQGGVLPPRQSNTTSPSPKTEIPNILFHILNLWLRIYCSGLRGCDTREKEIVIWPCWCFHGRYYFYCLKFTLMFINERKRNANTYLISDFDSLEGAPSNLRP